MNQNLSDVIKKKLEEEKTRLATEINELAKQDPMAMPDHENDNADSGGEASEQEGHERMQALITTLNKRLENINEALMGIANGTYGTCLTCSKEIEEKRLIAMPTATTCISCGQKSHA